MTVNDYKKGEPLLGSGLCSRAGNSGLANSQRCCLCPRGSSTAGWSHPGTCCHLRKSSRMGFLPGSLKDSGKCSTRCECVRSLFLAVGPDCFPAQPHASQKLRGGQIQITQACLLAFRGLTSLFLCVLQVEHDGVYFLMERMRVSSSVFFPYANSFSRGQGSFCTMLSSYMKNVVKVFM